MMPARRHRSRLQQHRHRTATRSTPITNQLVNFGWEYVFHCHILSHEEMDMMRPVSVVAPAAQGDGWRRLHQSTGTATTGTVDADLERQLDHRHGVRRAADARTEPDLGRHRNVPDRRSTRRTRTGPMSYDRPDLDTARLRISTASSAQNTRRLRRGVPDHDRAVDLGRLVAGPIPRTDGPHGHAAGRPEGQADLD